MQRRSGGLNDVFGRTSNPTRHSPTSSLPKQARLQGVVKVVLDASAVLAVLNQEQGSAKLTWRSRAELVAVPTNLPEVCTKLMGWVIPIRHGTID
jgi:hypothetical protein